MERKLLKMVVAGKVGPYEIAGGVFLEGIAERLRGGGAPALAYFDETGKLRTGRLRPESVELIQATPRQTILHAEVELEEHEAPGQAAAEALDRVAEEKLR